MCRNSDFGFLIADVQAVVDGGVVAIHHDSGECVVCIYKRGNL